jgi:DNA-binding NarL/FixJ family response regulator
MVREQLSLVISQQPDLEVCGEAEDVAEAVTRIGALMPDAVVVDLNLKTSQGLDLIKDIKARGWSIPILVLSMHDESLYAERVLRAGGMGYISKQENTKNILAALRRVLEGHVWVSPDIADMMMKRMVGGKTVPAASPVECLADRELEVFQLIGQGQTTRKISESLKVSIKTVESYRARIKEKLHLDDGVQLLQRAVQWLEQSRHRK